jgi:hypothetical protein
MEGGRLIKNTAKKVRVWTDSWREKQFEFPYESARLQALHFHGEAKQVKKKTAIYFFQIARAHLFQIIKSLIRIVADINFVWNVPKDLLGRAGQSIGVFEFLRSDPLPL